MNDMKIINNFKTVIHSPALAIEYSEYVWSSIRHFGRSVRVVHEGIKLEGFSGFSEYHSCLAFVSPTEQRFLEKYPFAEGAMIDVGANLGVVSLILGRRFPDRALYAFEPNKTTFRALQSNIRLNQRANLQPYEIAVASHSGHIDFNLNPKDRGTASVSSEGGKYVAPVPCVTLDQFAENHRIQEISFLKVDVEGYETLVFDGAMRLIRERRIDLIYFEVCPKLTIKAGFDPAVPARILQEHGYNLRKITVSGELTPINLSRIEKVEYDNWVAVRA